MKNKISDINDVDSLKLDLARCRARGIQSLYRGQSDEKWGIDSSLQRLQKSRTVDTLWSIFKSSFSELAPELRKLGYLKYKPEKENTNFYLLSVARHLGFPCNLIDWTLSIDRALLAACGENIEKDGSIFILSGDLNFNKSPIGIDPLTIQESVIVCKDFDFLPDHCNLTGLPIARKRRFRQNGFYSLISQEDTEQDFERLLPNEISLCKIVISNKIKHDIVDLLEKKGLTNEWFLPEDFHSDLSKNLISSIVSKYFK